MKKVLYFLSPFLAFSLIFLLDELLYYIDFINYTFSFPFFITLLFLSSAIIGSLSRANRIFDYLITVTLPISFFFVLFLSLFFQEIYDCVRFDLHHALNIEYYRAWLPWVLVMTALCFAASFKPIRLSKILNKNKNQL